LIDKLYRPRWSRHEPELDNVDKVVSASISLATVLAARRAHEAATNESYDLVLALRPDLVWYRQLLLPALPRAQLWLPAQCCAADVGKFGEIADSTDAALKRALYLASRDCFGRGLLNAVCTTSRFLRMGGGELDMHMEREAEFNYYVNDWMFLAPPATADTFTLIAQHHERYLAALAEVGVHQVWMHFMWAAHVHHALRVSAGVRPALEAGTEFNLVRLITSARYCRSSIVVPNVSDALPPVRGPMWGGMAKVLCSRAGAVSCAWESPRCSSIAIEGPS